MFQVPTPLAAGLDARLEELGWDCRPYGVDGIHVMTADVAHLRETATAVEGLPPVVLRPDPSPGWFDVYRYRGRELPEVAVEVLRKAAAPVFAEVTLDGQIVAIGRGALDAGWLGIFAMETVESARRRGLARHVLLALVRHAADAGARHVYLQVEATNSAAIALYTSVGLTVHHSYHYRALMSEPS
jgi:GNAT superfamily N-acetyltransferase